ncbi:MAG TPA: hypothetical protein VMI54_14165 [Polyangiaceae bacterium]|nr:hypothetical protein [Polyangiaceae bacterium]
MSSKRLRVLAALGSFAAGAVAARARAEDASPVPVAGGSADSAETAALRAELERQRADIDALKRAEAERRRRETELEDARAREPLVRFSGYVQIDWVPFDQASVDEVNASSRAPLNQERFTLRRGHVRADAEHGLVSAALELDANTTNGAEVRPIDAEVSLRALAEHPHCPTVVFTAGLFKIPFGFEVQELDVDRPFLERSSVARALFPGEFDLGARVWLRYRFLDAKLAVMNGHPIGDRVFPALDPDSAKELVARLGARAELVSGVVLDAGVSAERGMGFHEGTPTTKDQLTWRDDNGDGIVQATEIQVIPGSSATPSELFRRFGVGLDARLALALARDFGFELRAELMRAENLDRGLEPADPIGAGYDLREFGYYVGATQELTRFALVGLRYDRYDPDEDARELRALNVVPRNRSYSTLALLAMLRYDGARLSVEYDRNGNALGRAADGSPTTLASDTLTVRAQARF